MVKTVKPAIAPSLPDIAAMEAYAAVLTRDDREGALLKAQDKMYDAWERKTARAQKALAIKAIECCPLCADAYNLLANHTADLDAAVELYRKALRAGELALGPEGFSEYEGEFWGFLETRPYMRARHGLALLLSKTGEDDQAITHFRAMLDLNPNDNQGIRYLLLAMLMRRDETKAAQTLLASYPNEWSVHWLYTKALLAYREGRKTSKTTLNVLDEARDCNPHVPALLAGTAPPLSSKSGWVTVGGPEEAAVYAEEYGEAWQKSAGAIDWLAAAQPT